MKLIMLTNKRGFGLSSLRTANHCIVDFVVMRLPFLVPG